MEVLHALLPEVVSYSSKDSPSSSSISRYNNRESYVRRVIFSFLCVLVYLILSSVPVFGAFEHQSGYDPFYAQRLILSANRGSLLELGLGPIISAGMFLQVLVSAGLIQLDQEKRSHKEYMQKTTKIAALALSLLQAAVLVFSDSYGPIKLLGYGNAFLIIFQLCISSLLVILMDEAMEKGHGIGSGVSLFMCCHICTEIIWKILCPFRISSKSSGLQFVGILPAIPHLLLTEKSKLRAIYIILFREEAGLSNLVGVLSMLGVYALTVMFQNWRIELPLHGERAERGRMMSTPKPYTIPLFYTSSMPVILYSTTIGNFHIMSQCLYTSYPKHGLVQMIGTWKEGRNGQLYPISGLAHLTTPPNSFLSMCEDPLQALFYVTFVLAACSIFSQIWVETSGIGTKYEIQELKKRGLSLRGRRHNEATYKYLHLYISTATSLGGIIIGEYVIVPCYNIITILMAFFS